MEGRVAVWGVLNVTPDSFSDGGVHLRTEDAIAAGLRMLLEGADVIDVGGESTRPAGQTYGDGYRGVPEQQELARVVPVVRALAARGTTVSIDTTKPGVARAALAAGARIVNDVSCASDPALAREAARAGAGYVVMHRQGRGEVPPDARETSGDVVRAVVDELREAAARVCAQGVPRERVLVDPGIGFSKPARHSLVLLGSIAALRASGYDVLVGPSRKSFIAFVHDAPPGRRLGGTIAACLAAAQAGAAAVRAHDVEPVVQALRVWAAIAEHGRHEVGA